jgi:ferritin-like metal-binding protein YciE
VANLEVKHEQSLSSPHAQDRIMAESAQTTASVSHTEIMIRNLQAAGYSEDDIQYEMSGYGCAQTFARLLGDEQAAGVCDPRQFSNGE